ncbi:MAG TPA: hypothetical protein VFO70_06420 [Chitinophagaceae bacterium]|nr:hypothetical protein [Chitinophagaceae bacterium]
MKKILLLTVLAFIIAINAKAQAAKSIYFELGGPGLASVNFDTRFSSREGGLGGRIGVGGFSVDGTSAVFIPIGINYLLGKDTKNYFEIGGGITPTIVSDTWNDETDTFTGTFGHLIFGYRLQPQHGGFTFRAFICPIIADGGFIPYYAGISFGYKFGR